MLPLLSEIKLNDVNILITVLGRALLSSLPPLSSLYYVTAEIYRVMLSDKKYGLTMTIVSTRVLPVLVPQLVNPQLDLENYILVQSIVQDMLDHVDRHQRNKLKNEGEVLKSPDHYRIKYDRQLESMAIPNLVIRRPSVVQVLLVKSIQSRVERCFPGSGCKQLWTENISIYCNNLCK